MNYAGVCTYVKIFVCVCVCMCKEREREREREREKEKGKGGVKQYMLCVKMRHLKCKYTHVRVHCTQQCITFTHNLPDSNAMLLPGRVPGYEESDVKLLVSTIIKHTGGSVMVMKPMKDLYRICQQNSGAIMHLRIALKRRSQHASVVW